MDYPSRIFWYHGVKFWGGMLTSFLLGLRSTAIGLATVIVRQFLLTKKCETKRQPTSISIGVSPKRLEVSLICAFGK